MKKIYLRYDTNFIVDREETIKEHSAIDYIESELSLEEMEELMYSGKEPPQLYDFERNTNYCNMVEMPLLISIEGSYVKVDDIPKLVINKNNLHEVVEFIDEINSPSKRKVGYMGSPIIFKWKKLPKYRGE